MNELSKSVLRRAQYHSENGRIAGLIDLGEIEVPEAHFRALMSDINEWIRAYPIMIDGVRLKILWDKR